MGTNDHVNTENKMQALGLFPAEWEPLFRAAGVRREALDAALTIRGRQTVVGSFLRQNLDREVRIQVDDRPALARLRGVDAGRGRHRYYFEVRWIPDDPPPEPTPPAPAPTTPSRLTRLREAHRLRLEAEFKAGADAPPAEPGPRAGAGNDEDWD